MIPENIKQLANKVRNEIYGRDVRESIAQSMEVSGETSNEANERSKDTDARQTDVENRFDDQIAGNTDIDEVIDARRPEGGESYPTLRKRLDDEHKEVTTQLAQTAKIATSNQSYPVRTPGLFNWQNHPLRNKIFTDGYGNFHLKDFDIRVYKPKGNIYYVDINNGDDNNDGLTLSTALKTLNAAYDKLDCVVIKVAEGVYHRREAMWGKVINRDLSIEALNGHDVLLTQAHVVNWKADVNPNVYYADTSSGEFILDTTEFDEYGNYYKYNKVNDVDGVANNAGTYAITGGKLYIHTIDGREPDNDTIWRFTDSDALKVEGNCTLYLEGIKQWGGNSPLIVRNTSGSDKTRVFAKDCEFRYSNSDSNDVVWIQGVELAIFENCIASYGEKDGFNYSRLNGIPTNAIEINCVGKHNGTEGRGSDQGSTQHTDGKIIRINGNYNNNNGSNIADDGVGTQSWNLGCIGFESRSGTNSQRANFYAYTDVDMWLDGCVGFDVGTNGSDIAGNGNVYVRNNNLLSDNEVNDGTLIIDY